jgi:hypothetical protein
MTPLIIAALLGLTALLIVAYPLLGLTQSQREVSAPGSLDEVAERERQARQALREVELDYTLGNLESGDYDALRGRYERRALAALRTRYQREQELDVVIERQLDALRASNRALTNAVEPGVSAVAPKATTSEASKTAGARPATSPRVTRRDAPRDRRARGRKGGL